MVTIDSVEIADKLRRARGAQIPKVSQKDAADILGVSREAYVSYETGRVTPTAGQVRKLAAEWEIPHRWFFDGQDTPVPMYAGGGFRVGEGKKGYEGTSEVGKPLFPVAHDTVQIPMWPAVPAGDWEAPSETVDFYDVDVRLYKRNRVACKVVGDSMHPFLQQGDVGVFELNQHPQVGLIVLARNGDAEATVKQLSYNESGYVLISLKDGEQVHASKWEVLGFLVARVRDLGPGRFNQVVNQGGIRPEELI